MKQRHKILSIIALASTLLVGGGILSIEGVGASLFKNKLRLTSPTEYKLVLNASNQATVAEIGTYGDSTAETNIATRNTQLGNPIEIAFCSGRGVTNNDEVNKPTKFCNMPNAQYGWLKNNTALNGITKIKVNVEQTGASFRLDMNAGDTAVGDYYYTSNEAVYDYRSKTYTGSTTYEIALDGQYNFFRFQSLGTALSLVSLEITFNCYSFHNHDSSIEYIEHEATAPFRGAAGNIAYKECPICHKLFDTNGTEIDEEDTILESYFYHFNEGTTQQYFDFECASDATVTIDVKLNDPETYSSDYKRVYIGFVDKTTGEKRTGLALIKADGSCTAAANCSNNAGQTFMTFVGRTTDGYLRYSFDLSKISYETGFTTVQKITVYKWEHTSGNFEVNCTGGSLLRGKTFAKGTSTYSITSQSITNKVMNVDVYYGNAGNESITLSLRQDSSNYFGNYELKKTGMLNYDGVTVTDLTDGFVRYSFDLECLTNKTGTISAINEIYMTSATTAYGNIDYSFDDHVHSFVEHPAVAPNRGTDGNIAYKQCSKCGKLFNMSDVQITQADTVDPSRQVSFVAGTNQTYTFAEPYSIENDLVIDFQLEDGKKANIALMRDSSWDNFLGYFAIFGNGTLGDKYNGVSISKLSDGYVRVTFDFDAITKVSGAALDTYTSIKWIYIRGGWTDGTGYMDVNPQNDAVVLRGKEIVAGSDKTFSFANALGLTDTVNVDFYMTSNPSETKFSIMIGNWDDYFGYFDVSSSSSNRYNGSGVTYTQLSDGYYRASFKLNELVKTGTSGLAPSPISFCYVRGGWTTASGYIDVSVIQDLESPVIGDLY